ncbi:MAG: hypothetical protein HYS81_00250 [Candidatus Aenigmatarchaeota archaeon]|nr:MAG: hypothetical protein HYS81_00250 [Candidatus Aenigmarchaeota archaeon]
MVHTPSLKRSLYSRSQTHDVPVHGANVATGTILAAIGGVLLPAEPVSGTLAIAIAAAINGYSGFKIAEAYNEHAIGYE